VLAVGALVYGANVRPQAGTAKEDRAGQPTARSRVAVVNLAYVIKNYEKFKTFQQEIKEAAEPFQQRDTDLKARAESLAKQLQDPGVAAEKKPEIEKKLRLTQRKIEDNTVEAKRLLSKKTEEHTKTLYVDVEKAAKRYAEARDLELVQHYNEAPEEELYSPANIARKLQGPGGLMPLYMAPGIDVSKQLVEALNRDLHE
jgi:Skp family chaperone for outer membrane proteins